MIIYSVKNFLGIFVGIFSLVPFLLSLGGVADVQRKEKSISYKDTAFAWWIIFFHLIIYSSLLFVLIISRNNIKPYVYTSNMFVLFIGILASIKMVETHTIISVWRSISSSVAVNSAAAGFIFMTFQDIVVGLIITIFDKYHMVNDCYPTISSLQKDNQQVSLNTYPVSTTNTV